jgi:hypothetical protein
MSRSGASRMCRVGWLTGAWECMRCTWTILLVVYPDCTGQPSNRRMTLPGRCLILSETPIVVTIAAVRDETSGHAPCSVSRRFATRCRWRPLPVRVGRGRASRTHHPSVPRSSPDGAQVPWITFTKAEALPYVIRDSGFILIHELHTRQ